MTLFRNGSSGYAKEAILSDMFAVKKEANATSVSIGTYCCIVDLRSQSGCLLRPTLLDTCMRVSSSHTEQLLNTLPNTLLKTDEFARVMAMELDHRGLQWLKLTQLEHS